MITTEVRQKMKLKVERPSPTTLMFTRDFAYPPGQIWDAHLTPESVKKWMTGPEGWAMSYCEIDARPGGSFRYDWREDSTGNGFYLTAQIEVFEPPHRMVHVEVMHLPDPTPENRVETKFEVHGDGTRMTLMMEVSDPATMDAMIASGMADGMEGSYAKLDGAFK